MTAFLKNTDIITNDYKYYDDEYDDDSHQLQHYIWITIKSSNTADDSWQ